MLDILRFRAKVKDQDISVDQHSNKGNKNAQVLNHAVMKKWFEKEANTNAEEVPVSFQHQKKENGVKILCYVRARYQLLPAYYTWEYLRKKYLIHVKKENIRVAGKVPPSPSLSSFRAILMKECPNIKIRSPRDNVCDQCVIYSNALGTTPSVGETENMSTHVKEAVAMR